jgi:hypothetical protein
MRLNGSADPTLYCQRFNPIGGRQVGGFEAERRDLLNSEFTERAESRKAPRTYSCGRVPGSVISASSVFSTGSPAPSGPLVAGVWWMLAAVSPRSLTTDYTD